MVGVYCFVTKACARRPGAAASLKHRRRERRTLLAGAAGELAEATRLRQARPSNACTLSAIPFIMIALLQTYERMYEALRNQYLAEKSGQITPEQYQEIMDVMLYFDKDKDKCLNEPEFRNCITGVAALFERTCIHFVRCPLLRQHVHVLARAQRQ